MMDHELPTLAMGLAGIMAGLAAGAIYFYHLRATVAGFVCTGARLSLVAGGVLRIAAALAFFYMLVTWSPLAAIGGMIGFGVSRLIIAAPMNGDRNA